MNAWAHSHHPELEGALADVRTALRRLAGIEDPDGGEQGAGAAASGTVDAVARAFRLSPFERDVVLLCAGAELDGRIAAACAAAHGDARRTYPTFGLALAALPGAHWSALAPASALRRWRLVEVGVGETLTESPLRIDERVLNYLLGISHLDERLEGLLYGPVGAAELAPSHQAAAERIAAALAAPAVEGAPPLVELCGRDRAGKDLVAAAAVARLGLELWLLRAGDTPGAPAERETLARLCEREAILGGVALLVVCGDDDPPDAAVAFLESMQAPVLAASREPIRFRSRAAVRVDIAAPRAPEREELWRRELGTLADDLEPLLPRLASQFELGLREIQAACGEAARAGSQQSVDDVLWEACRAQARPRLEDLAQRIEPAAGWDDLVLPDPDLRVLRELATHVRHRTTVYERWGFAAKSARGLGISALFAGPSGTGKTMAAEVLANELRLDLHRIDLSSVVSKYIGETEKNLRRVFDAAEEGACLLVFDEADALFGRRAEQVRDSHDRYANIEVSYLLQRMEAYRGLAILTTNMKEALDPAFLRRIRFVVRFAFPDAAQRAEIWRRVFPRETPTEGLEPERLARLNVAGGSIRAIAINAAFLAAEASEPVRMRHLVRAAQTEYAKLEKPLSEAEFGAVV